MTLLRWPGRRRKKEPDPSKAPADAAGKAGHKIAPAPSTPAARRARPAPRTPAAPALQPQFDQLILGADSLDSAADWCRQQFGAVLRPGPRQPLMGTHGLIATLDGGTLDGARLTVLAPDPDADPACPVWPRGQRPPRRWHDLDHPVLRQRLRDDGPQLIGWRLRVADLAHALLALARLDIDAGECLTLPLIEPDEPPAPGHPATRWEQLAVRPDGRQPFGGALPMLVQAPPAAAPPPPGAHPPDAPNAPDAPRFVLTDFSVQHPQPLRLRAACAALGIARLSVTEGPPSLRARLRTPAGLVTLSSSALPGLQAG